MFGKHFLPAELEQPGAATAISAGQRHQLILKADGSVAVLGNNAVLYKQIETTPDVVRQPGAVKAIAAGKYHSLALLNSGKIAYWTGHVPAGVPPSEVTSGSDFVSIHAGDSSSFAVRRDGTVFGWGVAVTGTTGTDGLLPPVMTGFTGVKELSVSTKNGWLALFNNGTLFNYTTTEGAPGVTVPIVVEGVANVSVSPRQTPIQIIAVMQDGTVRAWGRDDVGQVSGPAAATGVQSVAASLNSWLLFRNGSIKGYGENDFAQLVIPADLGPVRDVKTGEGYVLALKQDGSVRMWGKQRALILPPGLNFTTPLKRMAVGWIHTVVLTQDGRVFSWGADYGSGELTVPPLNASDPVVDVGAGRNHSLLLLRSGRVVGFGLPGDEAVPAAARTNVQLVAGGCGFSVAVRSVEPRVVVWGQQDIITQCGLDAVPPLSSGVTITKLSVGCQHVLALLSNGGVAAWGCNNPGANQATVPASLVSPVNGVRVVDLAAGDNHSVALLSNGRVVAWGDSRVDQYRASVNTGIDDALAIGAGPNMTLVHRASGQLWYYGPRLDEIPDQSLPTTGLDVNAVLQMPPNTRVLQMASMRNAFMAVLQTVPPTATQGDATGSSGLSTGAVVGIAVGASCAVIAVVAAAVGWWLLSRRRAAASTAGSAGKDGASGDGWAHVGPLATSKGGPAQIAGLAAGEVFTRATAFEYSWLDGTATLAGAVPVEAGINDVHMDRQAVPADGTGALTCPVVQLSRDELKGQVHLLQDGLLGRGGTALCFQCVWPSRFGTGLLAAKVLKDGYEVDMSVMQSLAHEVQVLSSLIHPNVVRIYGVCLEAPTVCLILELLPGSLTDVLYRGALTLEGSGLAVPVPQSRSHRATNTTTSFQSSFPSGTTGSVVGPDQLALSVYATAGAAAPAAPATDAVREPEAGRASTDTQSTTVKSATPTSSGGWDTDHWTNRDANVARVGSDPLTKRQPLTMRQALHIMADVAAGLEYLHSATIEVEGEGAATEPTEEGQVADVALAGSAPVAPRVVKSRIVHRDLKPANVLINSLGCAKLSDFGLARQHQHTTVSTMATVGAGTIPYMPPEMFMGMSGGLHDRLTNRCDIYSVGMMMWELLSGHTPWEGMGEAAIVAAVVGRRRPELPSRADILRCKDNKPVVSEDAGSDADDTALPDADAADQVVPGGVSDSSTRNVADVPASLTALPELNDIIRACWQQRDLRRPTAAQLHAQLLALMQQSLGEEPSADALGEVVVPPEEPEHVSATPAAAHEITMEQRNNESS